MVGDEANVLDSIAKALSGVARPGSGCHRHERNGRQRSDNCSQAHDRRSGTVRPGKLVMGSVTVRQSRPGVLIVDDDVRVRSFLRTALEDNAGVVEAGTGEEALEILETPSSTLDLMLLDVHRRELIVAHDAFAEDDGVLEVPALPAHERHQHVLAERQLTRIRR